MTDSEGIINALKTLEVICKNSKVYYSIRFDHYNKMYTMRILSKNFCSTNLFECLKKGIKYLSIAEGYAKAEDWESTVTKQTNESEKEVKIFTGCCE